MSGNAINPAATIVDISHAIGPQNIAEGAFVLGESTRWYPPNSIHVAVVDPGVGTERKIAYARAGEQQSQIIVDLGCSSNG